MHILIMMKDQRHFFYHAWFGVTANWSGWDWRANIWETDVMEVAGRLMICGRNVFEMAVAIEKIRTETPKRTSAIMSFHSDTGFSSFETRPINKVPMIWPKKIVANTLDRSWRTKKTASDDQRSDIKQLMPIMNSCDLRSVSERSAEFPDIVDSTINSNKVIKTLNRRRI